MLDGMYSFQIHGRDGDGMGVLILDRGRIFGSDGGVLYDGTYKPSATIGCLDISLWLTVPPNVALVTGAAPQPFEYGFGLAGTIAARGETELDVRTPSGQVSALLKYLREIPSELAA